MVGTGSSAGSFTGMYPRAERDTYAFGHSVGEDEFYVASLDSPVFNTCTAAAIGRA